MNPTNAPATILRILAISLFAASCSDAGAPTAPDGPRIQSSVTVTYQAGGGQQFAFLEPLVQGEPSGPLSTGLSPVVEICNVTDGPPTDCIALDAQEEPDHYHANWRDRTVDPFETYRIEVTTSFGFVLGTLELFLDGESGDNAGRTFPIRFWIGEQLGDVVASTEDCVGDHRCNANVVADDEGVIIIETEDEDGDVMARLTFDEEDVPEGGIVVTLDCRTGGFAPGEGPLPTQLDQWPLFCNITATNPDGSLFEDPLPNPAQLDVCVVDENLQSEYHDFGLVADALVLGKSNGSADFLFLEKVASTLTNCDGNTTVADLGLGDRILHELDLRMAPLFGVLMPEGLRAAPMWFGDGGVGGLIGSFSDVNPVEPATIEGTVSHPSGPIEGVTVTLSGDASATTTTDASGFYRFSPLQAAPGGSNYTVTATPPPGESFADPDVDVEVTGTGTTTVDFETVLPAGIFYFEDTGNYYEAFATQVPWETANTNAEGLPSFRACEPQLVSILSEEEDAFIVQNMPQAAQSGPGSSLGGGYWLGGKQPDGSAEPGEGWQWITGESIPGTNAGPGYANWATGEPNNAGGGVGENAPNTENRLHYLGDWTQDPADKIRWNDEPDDRAYGYVVEYDCSVPDVEP